MKPAGSFGIAVGALMIGQWVLSLSTGRAPELYTAPFSIGFHLADKYLTAPALLFLGMALFKKRCRGRLLFLVASRMLLYSVTASRF